MICISLLALVFCCSTVCLSSECRPRTDKEQSRFVAAELYTSWADGRVAVDLASRRLSALYMNTGTKPITWGFVSSAVTSADTGSLKVSIRLRQFSPKSEWFKTLPPPDTGSVLILRWSDGVTSFAVPPLSMRKDVPKEAKRRYAEIDAIVDSIVTLRSRYWNSLAHQLLPKSDARVVKYRKDRADAFTRSLPKKRIGW